MEDCIFCKIVKGVLPAHKVYEDDNYFAFLDISPVNPGHTLVVPKEHYPTLVDVPDLKLDGYLRVVKMVAKAVIEAVDVEGFNLGLNNGSVAGQIVPHLHFHVIPRHPTDGLKLWPQGTYKKGEDRAVAEKIRGILGNDQ